MPLVVIMDPLFTLVMMKVMAEAEQKNLKNIIFIETVKFIEDKHLQYSLGRIKELEAEVCLFSLIC